MPRHTRTATAAAVVALAAAGCGNDPDPTPAAATPTPATVAPTTAAATTAPAATPTAAATPAADPYGLRKLGQTVTVLNNSATATVYGYRHNVARTAPRPDEQPGYVWSAVDVKVCAGKVYPAGITVTNDPWTLVYADDTTIGPSSVGYQQFPEPEYPFGEKDLAPGRCVRGWITFGVPGKTRPVAVEYAPEDEPVAPRWAVPKS